MSPATAELSAAYDAALYTYLEAWKRVRDPELDMDAFDAACEDRDRAVDAREDLHERLLLAARQEGLPLRDIYSPWAQAVAARQEAEMHEAYHLRLVEDRYRPMVAFLTRLVSGYASFQARAARQAA